MVLWQVLRRTTSLHSIRTFGGIIRFMTILTIISSLAFGLVLAGASLLTARLFKLKIQRAGWFFVLLIGAGLLTAVHIDFGSYITLLAALIVWIYWFRNQKIWRSLTGWLLSGLIAYICYSLLLMAFAVGLHSAVQAVQVEGDSMAPSYPANSRVLIDKTNHNPALNKVVVYSLPNGSKVFGRVVAINGDSYQVKVDNTSYNIPERTITSKDIVGVVTD